MGNAYKQLHLMKELTDFTLNRVCHKAMILSLPGGGGARVPQGRDGGLHGEGGPPPQHDGQRTVLQVGHFRSGRSGFGVNGGPAPEVVSTSPAAPTDRREWWHLLYQQQYEPDSAYELALQWSVATGSLIGKARVH